MLPIITFSFLSILGISAYLFYENRKSKRWIKRRLRPSREKRPKSGSANLVLKTLMAVGVRSAPSDEKKLAQITQDLSYAGYRGASAAYQYIGLRTLLALSLAVIFLLLMAIFDGFDLRNLLLMVLAMAVGYYAPRIVLKTKIKTRNKKIFRELPDTLDLLIICVEAGLGFEMALYRVSKELKEVAPVLSKEFAQYFFETRGGVARNEALVNLKKRNDSAGLHAMVDVVIQSLRFGTDISAALRVHSESMKTERQQIAEEKGAKVAVKLTLPMVILILPALLIIILGPALLRLIRHFNL